MPSSKSPAFQFYPAEFLADENVVLMNNHELGCYIKLMCYCWREGSIPADVNRIARLCGEDGSVMAELWLAISPCFSAAIGDPSRLVHSRLDQERVKQLEFKAERSKSGKKGAKSRWEKDKKAHSSAIKEPLAKRMANDGSLSSSSSLSSPLPQNLRPTPNPPPRATPQPPWALPMHTGDEGGEGGGPVFAPPASKSWRNLQ